MILYPAIDLLDGHVVRLERGARETAQVYENEPARALERFAEAGARWVHLVDLNRAFGDPVGNLSSVRALLAVAAELDLSVQVGGGVREPLDARVLLDAGAARVVAGTVAALDPARAALLVRLCGPRLVVALDARDGEVQVRGWTEGSGRRVDELARSLAQVGVARFLYTDVGRDGMGVGPDLAGAVRRQEETGVPVIASGGVGSLEHVQDAAASGVHGLVAGRAFYDGRLDLAAAVRAAGPQDGEVRS
jgi:phosphoribosylformimino-5-aminoimidazole carboxamide ribotide isomerase